MNNYGKDIFVGDNLKLARILNGLTLAELANKIGASRQYIHQLETDVRSPSVMQMDELASYLKVSSGFFSILPMGVLDDASIHFRSNRTAKQSSRIKAKANVALFIRLVNQLSKYVSFPEVNFPSETAADSVLELEKNG